MKKIFKKINRNEKGFALPLVLVLLLLGGLIISPLLGYITTGLTAGNNSELLMERLYTADAGVEDAIWQLVTENITVPLGATTTNTTYGINGMNADITITNIDGKTYRIISTATDSNGSTTTADVYVYGVDFTGLFNNNITSGGDIDWPPHYTINGTWVEDYDGDWPSAEYLSEYYLEQVDTSNPFPSSIVDVKNYPVILPSGSLYRDGNLDIQCSSDGKTGILNGTIYVAGDLVIGGPKDFTLDLNGQTIFVEGELVVSSRCILTGSGCIIAVGDIFFQPQTDSDPSDFVFVMSVEGEIKMNPYGDFYGALVGEVEVTIQPGVDLYYNDPTGIEFNFPDGIMEQLIILAWQVSP